MKYQIHLTFDNKRDRNAWVELHSRLYGKGGAN